MKTWELRCGSFSMVFLLLLSGIILVNEWAVERCSGANVYHRGNSSGYETWSASNVHYIDDVYNVTDGHTVYIEAGAMVFIDASHGGALAGSLVVKNGGTLEIGGSLGTPVFINANTSVPSPGDYRGIVVEAGGVAYLDYTYIGNATIGIEIDGGNSEIKHCTIKETSDWGVEFTGVGSPKINQSVINNTGAGNDGSGGVSIESNGIISECTIFNSSNTGILVTGGSPTIMNTYVHDASGNGVRMIDDGNPTMTGCEINDTGSANLYISGSGRNVTVDNCTIDRPGAGNSIKIVGGNRINLTILNCTYKNDTFMVDDYGNLTVKWFEIVYVKNEANESISGATVELINRTGQVSDMKTTNANGMANWLEGIEFIFNSTGFVIDKYFTIEASHEDYHTNSTSVWIDGFNNTTVELADAAHPFFGSLWNSTLTTGDSASFSANVTDNINVSAVKLVFSINGGSEKNWSINNKTQDSWLISISIPSNATSLDYFFWAEDAAGNGVMTTNDTLNVSDNDSPLFQNLWNSSLSTGETAFFSANMTDNIGVLAVLFDFTINGVLNNNWSVTNNTGNSWNITILIPSDAISIEYHFWANDTSHNWATSNNNSFQITDNDAPAFGTLWNSTLTTGDRAVFSANITDNIGVDTGKLDFMINGMSHHNWSIVNQTGNSWNIDITIPSNATSIEYFFWVTDAGSNWVRTINDTGNITDNDAPAFGNSWHSILSTGESALFSANITDNIDIQSVVFDFLINGKEHHIWSTTNQTENSWNITITIPNNATSIEYCFRANDTSENWGKSANDTLSIGDNDAPICGDQWHNALTTGESAIFSVNITDNVEVSTLKFDFTINDGPRNNWSVVNSTGNAWEITIALPADATSIKYYFWGADAANNWDRTNNATHAVNDNDKPAFGTLWHNKLNPNEQGNFSANITDNIAVDEVFLNFTINGSSQYSWSVQNFTGNSWYITIMLPSNATVIEYYFWTEDAANNWEISTNQTVGVGDNESPIFGSIWNSTLTTGESAFFSANITDNIFINSVEFDYTINGVDHYNYSTSNQTGDSWAITIILPSNAITIEYYFWCVDTSENWAKTQNDTLNVIDNDSPVFGNIRHDPLSTGDPAIFSADIMDNIEIDSVYFDYSIDGVFHYNWSVTNRTNDSWNITITIPDNAVSIEYFFWVNDSYDNWVKTVNDTLSVSDNDAPAFFNAWYSLLTSGESVFFSINITDNIGFSSVMFNFTINGIRNYNWSVTNHTGNSWNITITIPEDAVSINFIFWVNDSSNNANQTQVINEVIYDNDYPVLGILWHSGLTTGDPAVFSINATDNIGIKSVWFDFTINGMYHFNWSVLNQTGDSWSITINITSNATSIEFHFWVDDTSSNWSKTSVDIKSVYDNDHPVFGNHWNTTFTTGDPVFISVNVTDNVGMASLWIDFSINDIFNYNWSVTNHTENSWYITIILPSDAVYFKYLFLAKDTSNNWSNTGSKNWTVADNDAPVFTSTWNSTLTTGDAAYFSTNITENIGLCLKCKSIRLYFIINGVSHHNWSAMNNTGSSWFIDITIPSNAETIEYWFVAKDTSGNWGESGNATLDVLDNDDPSFGNLWHGELTTGDSAYFSANITDNINVDTVWFDYTINGVLHNNYSVTNHTGDSWEITLTLPTHSTSIEFDFITNDTSSRWATSGNLVYPVHDNDYPSAVNENENFSTGDEAEFIVSVGDNVAISYVNFYYLYTYTDGLTDDVYSMISLVKAAGNIPIMNETWKNSVIIPGDAVSVSAFYRVSDGTNSLYFYQNGFSDKKFIAEMQPKILNVSDNDKPEMIGDPLFNQTYNTGEEIVVVVETFDNSLIINNVTLIFSEEYEGRYLFDELYPNATYMFNKMADADIIGVVNFIINITDNAGNWEVYPEIGFYTFTVIDSIPPTPLNVEGNLVIGTGDQFTIICSGIDNIGITQIKFFAKKGSEGEWESVDMDDGVGNTFTTTLADITDEFFPNGDGWDPEWGYLLTSDGINLYYYILFYDAAMNVNSFGSEDDAYEITFEDNDSALVTSLTGDFTGHTDEDFIIHLNATDNIALDYANISIKRVDSDIWLRTAMSSEFPDGPVSGHFTITYQQLIGLFGNEISTLDGTGLHYYMEIYDEVGLFASSGTQNDPHLIDIADTIPPVLIGTPVFAPSPPVTEGGLVVTIQVDDNLDEPGDINATFYYNFSISSSVGDTKSVHFSWVGDEFQAILDEGSIPSGAQYIGYSIELLDIAGNTIIMPFDPIYVKDVELPRLTFFSVDDRKVSRNMPSDARAGIISFTIKVNDNIDSSDKITAEMEYTDVFESIEGVDLANVSYHTMKFENLMGNIRTPDLVIGFVSCRIILTDSSGNVRIIEGYVLNITTNDLDGDRVIDEKEPIYESLNPNGSPKGGNNTILLFKNDPDEWRDSDGDGVGDNSDAFIFDPAAAMDTDGDGYPDRWNDNKSAKDSTTGITRLDDYPDDPAVSRDSDGDGYPDEWNRGMGPENSTTGLTRLDDFPDSVWDNKIVREQPKEPGTEALNKLFLIALIIIVLIFLAIIGYIIFIRLQKDKKEKGEEEPDDGKTKKDLKKEKREEKKAEKKKKKDEKKAKKELLAGGPKVKSKAKKEPEEKKEAKEEKKPGEEKEEREVVDKKTLDDDELEDEDIDIDEMLPEELLSKEGMVKEEVEKIETVDEVKEEPPVEEAPPWATSEEVPVVEPPPAPEEAPPPLEEEEETEEELDLDLLDLDLGGGDDIDVGFDDIEIGGADEGSGIDEDDMDIMIMGDEGAKEEEEEEKEDDELLEDMEKMFEEFED